MTERYVIAVGLAAGLLVTGLMPAASLPTEVFRSGIGGPDDSAPVMQARSNGAAPGTGVAAPQTTTPADGPGSSAILAPAGSGPATGCDAQSMTSDPGPADVGPAACVAADLESDQAYLVETARPGSTMRHQGPALAIVRLHPLFVHRLAEAIYEARLVGLSSAGIFSAYRPPIFGVGRFADKFNSLHTYGLAVDMLGIGGPGSSEAKLWYEIAARHGIVCPYGAGNRREWNHCQPTGVKSIMAGNPLRDTVSPRGPIDLNAMFAMGEALVNGTDAGVAPAELQPAVGEKSLSHDRGQQPPQGAAGRRESVETRHDRAHPSQARHRPIKSIRAAPVAHHLHVAHGQPKHRIENPSVKNAPVKRYRTSSLIRRNSEENGRVDRSLKTVCRGC